MKNIRNRTEFLKETKELEYEKGKELIEYFMKKSGVKNGSFDSERYFKEKGTDDVEKLHKFFISLGYNLDEFIKNYNQKIITDDFFVANCGFLDYVLYTYDNNYELGGGFPKNEPSDTIIRYFYGYQNYNLGKIFIKQQFNTFTKFYRECAEVLPYYIFRYQTIGDGEISKENYEKNSTVLNKDSFFVSFIHLEGINCKFMNYEAFVNKIQDNLKDVDYKIVNNNLLVGFGTNIDLDKIDQKEIEEEEEKIFMKTTMKKYNL